MTDTAAPPKPRFAYGGQALLEGVLMRGRDAIGVAVRHPSGAIVYATEPLDSALHRNRFARAPFFRGLVVLYETLVIGTRWLMRSASVAAAGECGDGPHLDAVHLGVTIALVVGCSCSYRSSLRRSRRGPPGCGPGVPPHLFEGLIRVGIFVGYLLLVSQSKDIRRSSSITAQST